MNLRNVLAQPDINFFIAGFQRFFFWSRVGGPVKKEQAACKAFGDLDIDSVAAVTRITTTR